MMVNERLIDERNTGLAGSPSQQGGPGLGSCSGAPRHAPLGNRDRYGTVDSAGDAICQA
jgi:hypothetical protein